MCDSGEKDKKVVLPSNHSLERIGEQLMMIEQTVPCGTDVLKQRTVTSARLTFS